MAPAGVPALHQPEQPVRDGPGPRVVDGPVALQVARIRERRRLDRSRLAGTGGGYGAGAATASTAAITLCVWGMSRAAYRRRRRPIAHR